MATKPVAESLRKAIVLGGVIYSASLPLVTTIVWLASKFDWLAGIDKASKLEIMANTCVAIGFPILTLIALVVWLASASLSEDSLFYPFLAATWAAYHGLSAHAYGSFSLFTRYGNIYLSAPKPFYLCCTLAAIALLIAQMIDVLPHADEKESHFFRTLVLILWSLAYGISLIGWAWHRISSISLPGLQIIPLGDLSIFGWICAVVGASIYFVGFVAFMSWVTKGDFVEKMKDQLDS